MKFQHKRLTNTPLHFNDTLGFDGQSRIDSAREILFKKQTDREFLTAETITGGLYQNLLIKTISWRTDSNNPNSITFALTLKEVLVTATETTTYSPSSEEKRVQDQTSKTVKTGEKSATKLDSKDKTVTVQDKTKAQAAQKQAYEIKTSKVNR
ncbi:phage baseplate protein [Acinetobacter higginsii]|uniref:phage baseplate protein n=1 Tax=Acinetobacter higginsii TaxID=70347 RepID=UPI001F621158|nr:hypothetical protein [Acinetobacter higginsii]MCI3877562.1 hypothetical protein [Acinetobacter higginsii]